MSVHQPIRRRKRERNQPLALMIIDPTKPDPEEEDIMSHPQLSDFLQFICEGLATKHAAALAGITEQRISQALTPDDRRFIPAFERLFRRARAVFYKKQIDRVSKAQDWKAAAFWLERHEEEFALRRSENTVNVAVGITGKPTEMTLSPEQLDALSDAYDREKEKSR